MANATAQFTGARVSFGNIAGSTFTAGAAYVDGSDDTKVNISVSLGVQNALLVVGSTTLANTTINGTFQNNGTAVLGTGNLAGALPAAMGANTAGIGFGWNYTNGGGESDFINLQQGGAGGFRFYKNNNTGVATLLATLGGDGNLAPTSLSTATATVTTLNVTTGSFTGDLTGLAAKSISGFGKVYNAVWNDIADFVQLRKLPKGGIAYGRVYRRLADDSEQVEVTASYAPCSALGIASDTLGFGVGDKGLGTPQIPIAIGGFVLAYLDKPYPAGTPLVATTEGKLTKALWHTRILHPERILAVFDRMEPSLSWNGVVVRGRHWVKVK
jgi:hypothetical protein